MSGKKEEMAPTGRIMVVDDELHVRTTICSVLEKHGHRVKAFENCNDALAAFLQNGFDLVLTDVKMPGMDGVELMGRIREHDPDTPVILMTAYADLEIATNAVKKGAFDFIIKPLEFDYLLTAIAKGIRYRYLTLFEKDHARRLERALAEKSDELQQVHAQILLSEKMASIGLLAAGVAHEINNPLAFVGSNLGSLGKYLDRMTDFLARQTDLLEACCSPELLSAHQLYRKTQKIDFVIQDIRHLLEESLEGVGRIKRIVGSLKSFAHKDDNVLTKAQLNELIESTLTVVWNEIKYVATLTKELGDIPPINCFPSQLNQVIMNLLVNAAHAIEQQGTITVRTWQDGETVCFSVSDTGKGMPEEVRSKIFEPFFTTKGVGKGTGLGLSISYDIIMKHKGAIAVESEVGRGTTFTVHLPINPSDHD